jgi:hypothetical protein
VRINSKAPRGETCSSIAMRSSLVEHRTRVMRVPTRGLAKALRGMHWGGGGAGSPHSAGAFAHPRACVCKKVRKQSNPFVGPEDLSRTKERSKLAGAEKQRGEGGVLVASRGYLLLFNRPPLFPIRYSRPPSCTCHLTQLHMPIPNGMQRN